MARISRFKKRSSDLSGFDYKEIEMIREKGIMIGADERDDPPPSKLSLGGEGDISTGEYFRSSTSLTVDSDRDNPVFYITAAAGITPTFSHPYMRVTGSNSTVNLAASPTQIVSGREGQVLTLFGVGSSITLGNLNGVSLMGKNIFRIDSGSIITFIYNTGNNAWNETSSFSGEGIGG